MHPALNVVIDRLACVQEQAERLFEKDEAFRELCEEYQACCATLARMQGAGKASDALRTEYVALQLRLEGELLRYVAERPA
jgi:hypothetical protein